MSIHNFGRLEYRLVDFDAGEGFDDGKNNPHPHRADEPGYNGHNCNSVGHIDPSLEGATPKQALDFLAQFFPGDFIKEHSRVKVISAIYMRESNGINPRNHWFKGNITLEIPFEAYIRMGKPDKVYLPLQIETTEQ